MSTPQPDRTPALADLLDRLEEAPRVYSEFEATRDLLKRAARRERGVRLGRGQTITLQRGELLVSDRLLAERWQWTRHHVRSYLRARALEGHVLQTRIARLAGGAATKLTLVGFDTYVKPSTKANQARDHAKSAPAQEIARAPDRPVNQRPPHTPQVVHPSLTKERSRPLGGAGGGVASARDVDNRGKPTASADPHAPPVVPPDSPQLDLSGAVNPEHLHYAEQLAARLNQAQLGSGYVDRDTYRPVQPWHRGTLAAALAIKNAQVPLLYALEYVGLEGQRFKPTAKAAQISSLAYLQRGLIAAYRELVAKQRARGTLAAPPPPVIERTRIRAPLAVGDVLAGVLAQVREVRA